MGGDKLGDESEYEKDCDPKRIWSMPKEQEVPEGPRAGGAGGSGGVRRTPTVAATGSGHN